ncbi:hypothetical protein KW805_03245 [Candidatus Pacearchaeota archaeon]|nr:hypothetical protein [Candidatus Pacearchaeota archaeon]
MKFKGLIPLVLLAAGCQSHQPIDWYDPNAKKPSHAFPVTHPTTIPTSQPEPKKEIKNHQPISYHEHVAYDKYKNHQERHAVDRFNETFNLKGPLQLRTRRNEATIYENQHDIGFIKVGIFKRRSYWNDEAGDRGYTFGLELGF